MLEGGTVGGGTSGWSDGWLIGTQTTPPGPITAVTVSDWALILVVLLVVLNVSNPVMVLGAKVSVTSTVPTVPTTTVCPTTEL